MGLLMTARERQEREAQRARDFRAAAELIMALDTMTPAEVWTALEQATPSCLIMFVALGGAIVSINR